MDRRQFLQSNIALASAMTLPHIPNYLKNNSLGLVIHSYNYRGNAKVEGSKTKGFANAVDFIDHSHTIGAAGVQTTTKGWLPEEIKQCKAKIEETGLYFEGSVMMPKLKTDLANFEKEIIAAKQAGATVVRSVSLGGRRYEVFQKVGEWEAFKKHATAAIQWVLPILKKHQIKLAIENHKDWRADELLAVMKKFENEYLGVTLDFGNSIALLEQPLDVAEKLAPYAFSTHIKDMALAEYDQGFLLAEVPMGEGIIDLDSIVNLCKKHNPNIRFNLEMITRDPLKIPCFNEGYWASFEQTKGRELAKILTTVKNNKSKTPPAVIESMSIDDKLQLEENNILKCFAYAQKHLS
jgi:3-oxoisoapionate decarboxylase